MLSTRRIALASVIAPLGIALPIFVIGFAAWATFPFPADSPLGNVSPLELAAMNALQVHVALALVSFTAALSLRRFGVLNRRVLLLVGAAVSAMVGAWLSCDWGETCELIEGVSRFVLHGCTCFALVGALSVFWWWLASRGPTHEHAPYRVA